MIRDTFYDFLKKEISEYLSNFKTHRNDYFFILDYDNKRLFQTNIIAQRISKKYKFVA